MIKRKNRVSIALFVIAALVQLSVAQSIVYVSAQQQEYESPTWLKTVTITMPAEWYMRPFAPGWIGLCSGPGSLIEDPLAIRLMNGTFVPRLASSWEWNPETGDFTVHLRQGVIWHDGVTEYQSEDVLSAITGFNMYYYPQRWMAGVVDRISTPDDYTVVFHVVRPTVGFETDILSGWSGFGLGSFWMRNGPLYKFSNETVRKWVAENNTEEITKLRDQYLELKIREPELALGTGPFRFTRITDEVIIVEKWSEHYLADNNKFKGVIYYVTKTIDVSNMMFLSGEIYYETAMVGEVLKTIKTKPELTLRTGASEWVEGILMTMKKYPLSVKELRQALAYANNATAVCEYTAYGSFPLPNPGIPLYPAQVNAWLTPDFVSNLHSYTYDIDEANKILDDLNFIDRDGDRIRETPNGTKLEFRMATPTEWYILSGDWYAAEWTKIGVKVEVVPVPVSQYFVELSKWDFDMFAYYSPYVRAPAYAFLDLYTHTIWSPEPYYKIYYEQTVDVPTWVDPTAGTVNITQLSLDVSTTVDLEEYGRLVKILVWYTNEYVPQIFWGTYGRIYGFNIQKITGLESISDLDARLFASGCDADVLNVLISSGVIKPILTLSISAVGVGTTSPSAGTYTYTTNDTVTVTALPAAGFTFDHWELDGQVASRESTYTVIMDDSHSLLPVFTTTAAPPIELYAAIGILAVLAIAGWALAFMWRQRKPT